MTSALTPTAAGTARPHLALNILAWLAAFIALMLAIGLFRVVVLGAQLQIGPTPVFFTSHAADLDSVALQRLMQRVRVEPDGSLHLMVDPTQPLGCTTIIDYGNGVNERHIQFEEGAHIEDYAGRWPEYLPLKTLNQVSDSR